MKKESEAAWWVKQYAGSRGMMAEADTTPERSRLPKQDLNPDYDAGKEAVHHVDMYASMHTGPAPQETRQELFKRQQAEADAQRQSRLNTPELVQDYYGNTRPFDPDADKF